ncbi:MAG: hypothetical protein ACI81R_002858 [Bradymonadia bacterium]|jgi:hypothetical protein
MQSPVVVSSKIRWLVVPVASLLLILSSGCKKDEVVVEGGDCRIDYPLLDGLEGVRYDLVSVASGGREITRMVYDNGGDTPTRAIFYLIGEDGRVLTEAMDNDLDGAIDARLDAGTMLGNLVQPLSVDAVLSDGNIDGVQLSLDLSSSRIGLWQPARIFFQTPCDLGDFDVVEEGPKQLDIGLDKDNDGERDGSMTMQWSPDDAFQFWNLDLDGDGDPDQMATLLYDDNRQVTETRWRFAGDFFGDIYVNGFYRYDRYGNLYSFELDDGGDGIIDHRVTYSLACYPDNAGGAQ